MRHQWSDCYSHTHTRSTSFSQGNVGEMFVCVCVCMCVYVCVYVRACVERDAKVCVHICQILGVCPYIYIDVYI